MYISIIFFLRSLKLEFILIINRLPKLINCIIPSLQAPMISALQVIHRPSDAPDWLYVVVLRAAYQVVDADAPTPERNTLLHPAQLHHPHQAVDFSLPVSATNDTRLQNTN